MSSSDRSIDCLGFRGKIWKYLTLSLRYHLDLLVNWDSFHLSFMPPLQVMPSADSGLLLMPRALHLGTGEDQLDP